MDSKTVKLNCLTLGELENEPIFKKVECSFKINFKVLPLYNHITSVLHHCPPRGHKKYIYFIFFVKC